MLTLKEKTAPTNDHARNQRVAALLSCDQGKQAVVQSKPDMDDHSQLMLAVRDQRDKQSFAILFDHFAPRLKAMVLRSGARSGQAEEIVQEVMLAVWNKASQFDPHRAGVSAWIYQIARNRHIDVARKENKPVPEVLKHPADDEIDVNQIVSVQQETRKLRDALTELNTEQREMIEKAYLGEMTHQEISAQTGLPLGTIKSRIRLGLQRLRHELKELR